MPAPPWAFLSSASLFPSHQKLLGSDGKRLHYEHLKNRDPNSQSGSCTLTEEPSRHQDTDLITDSSTVHSPPLVGRMTGKPTITVTTTTTVFSNNLVTSTTSLGDKTAMNSQPAMVNPSDSIDVISSTTTTTIFVFRASSLVTTTNTISSTALQTSVKPAVSGSINETSVSIGPAQHAATITGATLGSMAFVGLIGALLWFCCFKSKSRREKMKEQIKLKTIITTIKRRKSNELNTPKLENQERQDDDQKLMEETRAILLKQKSAQKAAETGNESQANLISTAAQPGMSSSSLLPFTVQQQQSATQSSSVERLSEPLEMPAPLFYVSHAGSSHPSSSVSPSTDSRMLPRKPVQLKPAPILTAPQHVYQPERLSPLSPRAMFNAVSGAVKRLSPGGSNRGAGFANDGRGGFEALLSEDGRLKSHRSSSNGSSIARTKSKLGKWI